MGNCISIIPFCKMDLTITDRCVGAGLELISAGMNPGIQEWDSVHLPNPQTLTLDALKRVR